MFRRPVLAVALSVMAVLVGACGQAVPTAVPSARPSAFPSSASSSPLPAGLLLKVTSEGGFINPSATLAALPLVTVYTDGRILTPAILAADPPPLVTAIDVRDVGPAGATAILASIKTAGLDRIATGAPGIPVDSGTDVFTAVVDGATTTNRLAAGGAPGPGTPGGTGDNPGRHAAFDLLARLLDPTDTWGAGPQEQSTFAPTGYRVYVVPISSAPDPSAPPAIAWPLTPSLDAFGTMAVPDRGVSGLRQGVVLGPDAVQLAPVLRSATASSVFTSNGRSFTLSVRALLPDEIAG